MSSRRSHSFDFDFSGSGDSSAVALPDKNALYTTQGVITGFQLMLLTGAAVTEIVPHIWRGNVTDGSALVADNERIVQGAAVASPGASATVQVAQETFDGRPFGNGCTPVLDVAATGAWTARMTVHVELDG